MYDGSMLPVPDRLEFRSGSLVIQSWSSYNEELILIYWQYLAENKAIYLLVF